MYESFAKLDGTHPWRDVSPDGFVDYRARVRPGGRVVYFNFDLAREMRLIPRNHARSRDAGAGKMLLDTFAIQIINEYDIVSGRLIDPLTIKPKPYMATRYLQAQHKDKRGLNSGDGRAIWNGAIEGGRRNV